MTLISLFFYVGLAALALTLLVLRRKDTERNFFDSFLQNFAGSLFIFSGFVKAVDPLGTAYKMEQYFTAFEDTCNGSFLKFMSGLFPVLSNYSVAFSVFMIVLEITLGVMLIIGYQRKLSAWLFLVIMVFFTILTGFTFLTGYVPTDANFFEFSKWTAFNKNQMRVTDCGCFGDFIKLEPKVSFIKDLVLMIPAVWFLMRWRKLHVLFSPVVNLSLTILSIVGFFLFSISNFIWNEPVIDFRPFNIGVDVKSKFEEEQKALAEVEIIAYKLRNKQDRTEIEIPYKAYLDSFKMRAGFRDRWETLDQVKSEPKIPRTKISDFEIISLDGQSATESLFNETAYHLMIVSPKVKYNVRSVTEERIDTLYKLDTTILRLHKKDSLVIKRIDAGTEIRQVKRNVYQWDADYVRILKTQLLPLVDSVKSQETRYSAVFGGLTEEGINQLKIECGINFQAYEADDLLLKTIMRSNPGLVLWKNGKIIHKWHHRKLPNSDELKTKYLSESANKVY